MENTQIAQKTFEVWKNIKTGTYSSVDELMKDVRTKCNIEVRAGAIMRNKEFQISLIERNLDLVVVKQVQDLGLGMRFNLEEVFNRAMEFGLEPCPAEVGPYLVLQDIPYFSGNLHIAMTPFEIEIHRESRFSYWSGYCSFSLNEDYLGKRLGQVRHTLWLNTYKGYSDDWHFADRQWVFCISK